MPNRIIEDDRDILLKSTVLRQIFSPFNLIKRHSDRLIAFLGSREDERLVQMFSFFIGCQPIRHVDADKFRFDGFFLSPVSAKPIVEE